LSFSLVGSHREIRKIDNLESRRDGVAMSQAERPVPYTIRPAVWDEIPEIESVIVAAYNEFREYVPAAVADAYSLSFPTVTLASIISLTLCDHDRSIAFRP
jgi:hypothetical protein